MTVKESLILPGEYLGKSTQSFHVSTTLKGGVVMFHFLLEGTGTVHSYDIEEVRRGDHDNSIFKKALDLYDEATVEATDINEVF